MKSNDIIFADLSTYTPKASMAFYEAVFGWKYYLRDAYYTAYVGDRPVSGLYETPEKFKQMRMPSFWMTYIQVTDLESVVDKAKQLGGIIEMNYEMVGFGKVALIRDPQGAGFTLYEGYKLQSTRTKNTKNTLIWNELHVSDVEKVIPFYQGILEWDFKPIEDESYLVINQQGNYIADLLQIQNEYKGKYEYWVCTFGVEDLATAKKRILENRGNLISDEGVRMLFTDNSGEAFFYAKQL
ncbi:MAG: VOC family protein [Bacteroidota bacterium]